MHQSGDDCLSRLVDAADGVARPRCVIHEMGPIAEGLVRRDDGADQDRRGKGDATLRDGSPVAAQEEVENENARDDLDGRGEPDAKATVPGRHDQAVEHDKGHEDEVDLPELEGIEEGLQADGADCQEPPQSTIDP